MNRRLHRLSIAALIGSAAFLAGCYTLLRHPTTEDGYEHADFGECAACHDTYSHFTPYDPLYPDRWWSYYAVPWWYGEVIAVDGGEEAPIDRTIRSGDLLLRDGTERGGPVLIKRRPFSGSVDTSGSGREPANEAGGERRADETKHKDAPSKRTKKQGEGDREGAARERSRTDGSSGENGAGGETRKEKRKEP